jgi:hypothetical protein
MMLCHFFGGSTEKYPLNFTGNFYMNRFHFTKISSPEGLLIGETTISGFKRVETQLINTEFYVIKKS